MAKDAAELASRLHGLATAIDRGRRKTVVDMALVAKDEANAGLRRVGVRPGGRSSRSGLRMPRANFSLRGTARPTALLRYFGPAHWWESGTSAHPIVSRKVGGSRRSRRARAESGTVPFRAGAGLGTPFGPKSVVRVRGMRARRFWAPTKRRIQGKAGRVLRAGLARNVATSGIGKP